MQVRKNTINLAMAGLVAALIALFIWFVRIPIPGTSGYVHLGDSLIYLAAYFLPAPYAVAAAAVGGGLADLCAGAASYVIPTAVFKGLMALAASFFYKESKGKAFGMAAGFLCGLVITVGGYFAYEWALWGVSYAAVGVLWNLVQATASALLTVPLVGAIGAVMKKR